jgi:hypothetical protein
MLSRCDLASLMKLRQVVAWTLPSLATVLTVLFFVSMASGSRWISRVAFGSFGSLAIVTGMSILVVVALCVWVYGWLSNVIERRVGESVTS